MTRISIRLRSSALVLSLAAAGGSAAASPSVVPGPTCDVIAPLKAAYLACERTARGHQLGSREIARCSILYERLKHAAFDGGCRHLRR